MNETKMWTGRLVLPDQIVDEGVLLTEGSKIIYAGSRAACPFSATNAEQVDGWIWPGLIDTHIHGIGGSDVMDGTPEALAVISQSLAKYGVTGFLATTMTAEVNRLVEVVENAVRKAREPQEALSGARLLGIHLEGPWINPELKGAQNGEFVVNPTREQVERIYHAAQGLLRTVTIAPELPGAAEAIRFLKGQGVTVSAGHTNAKFAEVEEAIKEGVAHFTHCFNAMRGLHHREPGVVGAAMVHDELSTELIADGIHVHPAVMKILYKVKQEKRIALISDAMRATGMANGEYDLGGQMIQVRDGMATLPDGTLAGSVLTLNRAVANLVTLSGVPLPDAVRMASLTPAEIIGVSARKGQLKTGYDADVTIVSNQFEVLQTFVEGKLVYQK
ncbi:N-acetylglucosamine-6-phosphate deacetylase [Brevibacillus fulvus]|uniref:N-acetylglucosamine-6-phosphate deacetylase n=1 Tax=Brevibacillus fulvus TaxID=1125967 RepID=A0A938Y0Q5_9BACL|nr:N-acetylglucosamine-6-phosphate deacetylase [Brevibacillus fulvus]MBM7591058.1 N-acetylglucosamine-6-phosphate deacetylase [Brevibacillus fulvus]